MQKIIGTLLMVLIGLGFKKKKADNNDSYHNRPVVEVITAEPGIIKKIDGDSPVYIIDCTNKYTRLLAYNLPDAYKKEGLAVVVSGNMKATNTLEDDCGELFEVTGIQ